MTEIAEIPFSEILEHINTGNVADLKILLQRGLDVNRSDEHGMSLLQHAAFKAKHDICKLLISFNVDVNFTKHENAYTALHFAALSGNEETVITLLNSGADSDVENSVNRTPVQMAGFTGQHKIVSLMNNYVPISQLKEYTKTSSKLLLNSEEIQALHRFILKPAVNPIRILLNINDCKCLKDNIITLKEIFVRESERNMKQRNTQEILSLKLFLYSVVLDKLIFELKDSECDDVGIGIANTIKKIVRSVDKKGNSVGNERLLRGVLRSFPYAQSTLLMQMLRQLKNVEVGANPTAISIFHQAINGTFFGDDAQIICATCGQELSQPLRCSRCQNEYYCNKHCQTLHWTVHKRNCVKK